LAKDAPKKKVNFATVLEQPPPIVKAKISMPNALQIHLPNGQMSSMFYKPEQKLREILEKLCSKRPELGIEFYTPQEMNGKELDLEATISEINLNEIRFSHEKGEKNIFELRIFKSKKIHQ